MRKLVLFFLLSLNLTFAQQYDLRFKTIDHKQGISSKRISAVLQDSNGILWMGNRIAIDRYDGDKTIPYTLPRNSNVNKLAEDAYQNIWATTYTGLYVLIKGDREFKKIQHPNIDLRQYLSQNIISMALIDGDLAYLGTDTGALLKFKYNEQGNIIDGSLKLIPTLERQTITSIHKGSDESLFLGTAKGMVLTLKNDKVTSIPLDQQTNNTRVNDLTMDQDGYLWVATNGNGLFKINISRSEVRHYKRNSNPGTSINNNIVLCLLSEKRKVWIGTDGGGLNLYDKTSEEFHYYTQNYYNPENIPDNSILAIERGHNNNILLATVHGGLSIVKNRFVIKNIPALEIGFSHKDQQGSTILEDSFGHIWLSAGRNGLVRYNPKDKTSSFYIDNPAINTDLNGSIVMSLLEDKNNRLWIATLRGGLSILDIKTNKFIPINEFSRLKGAYALELDKHGDIWVGHRIGITVFDSQFNIKQHLFPNEHERSSSNLVNVILKDVKGDMWVGTSNGLFRYEKDGTSYKQYSYYHHDQDSSSISGNYIRSIGQTNDLNILVGTYGYGLNKYNRSNNTFERYKQFDKIKGNTIEGILKDHSNNIWLSTNMGLTKIDTSGSITNFNENDGIYTFNGSGAYLAKNGDILMAGAFGLSSFSPHQLQPTTLESKINFTSVIAKNEDSESHINSIKLARYKNNPERTIELQPQTTFLTITYTSSDPIISQDLWYAYSIEELKDSWNEVGNLRTISFTNLDPGNYTLKVKAMDQNGNPSKHIASLQLKVLPALWQTLWFRIVIFLVLIILISITYHWRVSVLKDREQKLKQLLENKTEEVKYQQNKILGNKMKILKIEKEHHDLQQKQLRAELNFKNEELTNNTLRAVHKNDLLNTIKEKLKEEIKQKEISKKSISTLINHINDSFMFDKEWDHFYSLFNEIHPAFINNLKVRYPNLSERDIKLCALILMKFTSKDIATLFGISVSSVKIARHRLKKKLKLESHEKVLDKLKEISKVTAI
ncbi:ligand-binding sensor domain-containing protein [Galbibacter sp.]|uniref:ligand-binding sensor domain-containing protein n=1 Tax=Galbibacter sp. TaxID=2918471 RepID=UPI003A8EFCEF